MISMDQWHDLAEGANPHFRENGIFLAVHRHANPSTAQKGKAGEACGGSCETNRHPNLNANTSQTRHQLDSPMGIPITEHDHHVVASEWLRFPPPATTTKSNSNSSLEATVAGMTMNEWWVGDKIEPCLPALLDSITRGEHYARGEERFELTKEKAIGPATGEHYTPGEERITFTKEKAIGSANGEHYSRGDGKTASAQKKFTGSTYGKHYMGAVEKKTFTREGRGGAAAGERYNGSVTGQDRGQGNLQAGRVAKLEVEMSGNTMKGWWSSLSACMGGAKRSGLHNEILSFCKARELTFEQARSRKVAQDFLQRAVLQIWPNAKVHLYGSTAMGLALPTSDIDIVVVMQSTPTHPKDSGRLFLDTGPWVSELYSKLLEMPKVFQSLTQLPHAKVPILKGVFKNGLACDISFDWDDNRPGQGVVLVRTFLRRYKALKPLCMVLKSFLRYHKLNEVFSGGIGSFCLIIMIVNLLQTLPNEGASGAVGNDLGALLVSFFMYYTCMHNYDTDVVSTSPGRQKSHKQARGWVNWSDLDRLAVENPLNPTSDIGYASYNIRDVRMKLAQARKVLLRHWDEENLLDRIFKTPIT